MTQGKLSLQNKLAILGFVCGTKLILSAQGTFKTDLFVFYFNKPILGQ